MKTPIKDYLKSLVHQFWDYAESGLVQGADILETEHRDALRPPVNHLGEPRPTSVDLWIDGSRRIAVECKLTEADFASLP